MCVCVCVTQTKSSPDLLQQTGDKVRCSFSSLLFTFMCSKHSTQSAWWKAFISSLSDLCASSTLTSPIHWAANHPEVFAVSGRIVVKSREIVLNTRSIHNLSATLLPFVDGKYIGTNIISILHYVDEVRSSKTHLESPINTMQPSC